MKAEDEAPRKQIVGVVRSVYRSSICSHQLFKKYSTNYSMLIIRI